MTGKQPSQRHLQSPTGTPPVDLVACAEGLGTAVLRGVVEEVDPYGLSAIEFSLLRACMERGECTATDLVRVLPVDASRISRLVTRLVNKDLLVRRRLPEDRRMVMLRLSPKGDEMVSKLSRRIDTYNVRLMENIGGEELSMFQSVTKRILANYIALESTR